MTKARKSAAGKCAALNSCIRFDLAAALRLDLATSGVVQGCYVSSENFSLVGLTLLALKLLTYMLHYMLFIHLHVTYVSKFHVRARALVRIICPPLLYTRLHACR